MNIDQIKARLALIASKVTEVTVNEKVIKGIRKAYAKGPKTIGDDDMPVAVVSLGPATYAPQSLDFQSEARNFQVSLYIMRVDEGYDEEQEKVVEAFIQTARPYFNNRFLDVKDQPHIDTMRESFLLADSGVSELTYRNPTQKYLGTILSVQVLTTLPTPEQRSPII